jgi:peroxiredoxin
MSLQDKLDAFKAASRASSPVSPEAYATMDRATRDLIESGAARRALRAGDTAPAFTLADAEGAPVSSADLLSRGPLIVSFYRGVWCPYCNMELQALQESLAAFQAHGASLVAVSPQTQPNSRKAQRQNGLAFPILSDPGNEVAAAFGVRFRMPDDLVAVYRALKTDLSLVNGDTSWTLPMPARFVVGQDGTIRYAEVNPDYTQRPEPGDLLPALAAARIRAA